MIIPEKAVCKILREKYGEKYGNKYEWNWSRYKYGMWCNGVIWVELITILEGPTGNKGHILGGDEICARGGG